MTETTATIRPEKIAIVEEIVENLNKSTTAVLTDYRGLTAAEMTELRKGLRDAGINFKIFKNTLATIAAKQAGMDDLEGMLVGPTAIAFGFDDPIAVAKILDDFAKKHDALEIKGGIIEHTVIDHDKVVALAKLPGREQLIAQFVGLLNQPIVRLVRALNKPVQDLAMTLNAVAQNKK
jgi:large subunit ribosomal protein L10